MEDQAPVVPTLDHLTDWHGDYRSARSGVWLEVAQRAGGGAHRGVVVRVPGGGPEAVQGVRGDGAGVLSQEGVELL